MSERDRERWEAKHARAEARPAPPLASMAWVPEAPTQGVAIDVACGAGRHCDVLVSHGYRVVAADIAASALARLRNLNRRSANAIMPVLTDFDHWAFAPAVFDLVVQCDFLDRRLFSSIQASVRAGGYVLVDTFCGAAECSAGPRCRDYRLEDGELLRVFGNWEILHHGSSSAGRDAIFARKPQL